MDENSQAVFATHQGLMACEECRGAEGDGSLSDTSEAEEERTESAEQPVAQRQARRPRATATKHDELLFEQQILCPLSHPLQFLLVALAGWINQQQRDVIAYRQEENRVFASSLDLDGYASPTLSASASPRTPRRSVDGRWRRSGPL